jgi:hypothetical protein
MSLSSLKKSHTGQTITVIELSLPIGMLVRLFTGKGAIVTYDPFDIH